MIKRHQCRWEKVIQKLTIEWLMRCNRNGELNKNKVLARARSLGGNQPTIFSLVPEILSVHERCDLRLKDPASAALI